MLTLLSLLCLKILHSNRRFQKEQSMKSEGFQRTYEAMKLFAKFSGVRSGPKGLLLYGTSACRTNEPSIAFMYCALFDSL